MNVITIPQERSFYVKLSNFIINNNEMMGYKHVTASSGPDLLDKVCEYYRFSPFVKDRIQLHYRMGYDAVRIDTMDHIPLECDFISVVGYSSSSS